MTDQLEFNWGGDGPETVRQAAPPVAAPFQSPVRDAKAEAAEAYTRSALTAVLRAYLERCTALKVYIRVNENRSNVLRVAYANQGKEVRLNLHFAFLEAPKEVHKALAEWILHPKRKRSGDTIDAFIREQREVFHAKAPKKSVLRKTGKHHDLQALFDEVNREHFGGAVDAEIGWGNHPNVPPKRTIRLGSYSPASHVVRIHPYLDQAEVPRYIVKYVVFHEMLHAALGIEEHPSGRRVIHSPEFQELERKYPDFERATAWLDNPKLFRILLRGRRPFWDVW